MYKREELKGIWLWSSASAYLVLGSGLLLAVPNLSEEGGVCVCGFCLGQGLYMVYTN